jgi:uncharacterized RDD family membrane protein YckC
VAVRLGRAALGPARAAARAGKNALADEAERSIDAVLAGPLPEAVARSVVRHRVAERLLATALATDWSGSAFGGELERALERVVRNPAVERLAGEAVESAAFRRVLHDVLSSPELRRALSQQTVGFGAELAASLRRRAGRADDSVEAAARRRPRASADAALARGFGGLVTRGVALVVDAALAQLAFLAVGASIALVASLVGDLRTGWLADTLAGGGWLLVVSAYFVGFWSGTGQTPGMRLMRLRVLTRSGAPPSVWRSVVRLVGLVLAIVPLFAGFLPVVIDARRRALQDFLARTLVVSEGGPAA